MNKFNTLHGEETTEPLIEFNSQPTVAHSKSSTSDPKTIPVVSFIMGRLNHCTIDNGDVEVHLSDFPAEYNSEYVPDLDTTTIK